MSAPDQPAGSSFPAWGAVGLLRPLLLRSRGTILLIVVLGLTTALAETAGIGMILLLLSILFGSAPDLSVLAELPFGHLSVQIAGSLNDATWATLAVLAVIIFRLFLTTVHGYLATTVSIRLGHETRLRLFRSIAAMPFEKSKTRSWGELYALIDEHSHAVPESFDAVCNLVQSITICVGLGLLLIATSPLMALVAVAAFVLLHGVMEALQRPAERTGEAYVGAARGMSEHLIRTLQGFRTFHTLGLIERQTRRFSLASGRAAQAQTRSEVLSLFVGPASHVLALVAITAMTLAALRLGLGYEQLLLAVGLLYRLEPYGASIEEDRLLLAEKCPSLRLIMPLAAPVAGAAKPAADKLGEPIRLLGVDFNYGERDKRVFTGLNMTIPGDGWTLIDGPSGTGKSTLVNLLLGLIQPTRGTVLIGNVPLDALDLASWRRQVAVCGQDIELVSGTVRENLLLGARQRSLPAIERAIMVTGLGALIADLPLGLDTQLGEQGAQLSGGQRQRLAIARAVLRDPQILILDEGTSMLDRASQTQVLFALERIMRGRAVIVIGHNLSELPELRARFDLNALQGLTNTRMIDEIVA
ncbi:MAG: ATP-binding cassette, subfamily bacterial [Novosphingobium sp.]|nr:ATP-binding cassette, subfamily bacterial [Novosphingobium sp.]